MVTPTIVGWACHCATSGRTIVTPGETTVRSALPEGGCEGGRACATAGGTGVGSCIVGLDGFFGSGERMFGIETAELKPSNLPDSRGKLTACTPGSTAGGLVDPVGGRSVSGLPVGSDASSIGIESDGSFG